tara:strand:+ start:128 stop:880 length:753 start_codon:yes stop_codon:yes gene_type:complete
MAKENEQVQQIDPIVAAVEGADITVSLDEQPTEDVQEMSEEVNWETESKKFQSMYDKKTADYENLSRDTKELAELKQLLNSKPELVEAMEKTLSGESLNKDEEVPSDAFDPWDAYYKKDSPSYKMRVANEEKLVHETVDRELGKLQEAMAVTNLKNELKAKHKMSDLDAEQFLEFATTPRGDLPIDTLVKVWREGSGVVKENTSKKAVEKAQNIPKAAGVLQGGEQPQKSEPDQVWDRILSSGNRSRLAK